MIPQQQFSQWISPLQAEQTAEGIVVFAPNQYVLDGIKQQFLPAIESAIAELSYGEHQKISLVVGTTATAAVKERSSAPNQKAETDSQIIEHQSNLNVNFTFDNFVEGKSNQ